MRFPNRPNVASRAHNTAFPFLVWVTMTVITAIIGPFSTFDTMKFEVRILYWGGLIGSAIATSLLIRWVLTWFATLDPLRADLVFIALMATTFGSAVTLFNAIVLDPAETFGSALSRNIFVVMLVCFGVFVVRRYVLHLAHDRRAVPVDAAGDTAAPPQTVSPSVVLNDIHPEICPTVRWIEADDHYLRVHAANGSVRILMRFRDALAAVAHLPGIRVHRSHWVRIEAVDEVRPDGRRHVAVLNCGSEVPISRSYLGDLHSAGLMQRDGASEPG